MLPTATAISRLVDVHNEYECLSTHFVTCYL